MNNTSSQEGGRIKAKYPQRKQEKGSNTEKIYMEQKIKFNREY